MKWVRGEIIGHGSFSTVSLAFTADENSSTVIPPVMAVKSSEAVCSAALQNEKQVLDHLGYFPQIVQCFGNNRTVENGEEIHNLFLEYASGGSLADLIRNSGGALPEFKVRRFTRSILKGLCHIHANGFSHCDIKLENILIFNDGDVKISDFGLSKKTRSTVEETRVQIRGTPLYMAPESVNDAVFEPPADIWALGCCVVEMAIGKTAWCLAEGTNMMSLLVRIGVGGEVPIIPAKLSAEGKDFLRKCFVRDPEMRWTAEMLLDHPFVTVDEMSKAEEASVSPRCPFDFPDWISVQSPVIDPVTVHSPVNYSPFHSLPAERIRGMFTDEAPDWSVSCGWINVR